MVKKVNGEYVLSDLALSDLRFFAGENGTLFGQNVLGNILSWHYPTIFGMKVNLKNLVEMLGFYVYTDSQHQNPLSRVVPAQFIRNNDSLDYDKEKYKEMLLDASETVLGIFGFDRHCLVNQKTRNGGCN